jgi:hypothetical protein
MSAPDTAYVKQYQDTIYLLAQQMTSYLRSSVVVDTNWTGEVKFYDQYNQDVMIELMQRYQSTPVQLPDFRRRAVFPRYFVSATIEDPKDALQTLVDPKSTFMQAKVAAANRTFDDLIIAAMGGTAYTGKSGTTATSFASANQIVYNYLSAGNGMTKVKCIGAKRILDAAEVDSNDRYAVATSEQIADLLNTTEITSADYNVVKALVQGEINTWLGFQWIRSERLLVDSSGNRLCYFFQRWALQLAIQKDIEGRIDERADMNFAWQVYLRMCAGATRLEESRIVQVANTESW